MCTNRTATMLHESIDPADTGIIEYAICVFFSPLKIHTWRKNLSNIHIPWRGEKLAFLRGQFKFRKFRRNDISTQHCWHEQMNHGVRVNSRGFSKHFKLFSSTPLYHDTSKTRISNGDSKIEIFFLLNGSSLCDAVFTMYLLYLLESEKNNAFSLL